MKDALAIHRWLLAHQVHHEIVRLPRAMTCVDELPEVLSVSPAVCVGVTVYEVTTRIGQEPVAVVTSVGSPPLLDVVGGVLGARRIRHAPDYTVNAATDYAAGLVCPLLLPDELTVLVDERLTGTAVPVYTPIGERRTALLIRADHLLALVPGKIVDLTRPGPRREPMTFPLAG
ncbi:prolyl-tRNA editing enzyme YbaK/EbsC (Cys-tRNA(Pro) deacylase) [Streptosporangium becharense]|uniref:Prolyl-tRNA editing enzyme YbaK/EbsC (Cys-tRNA(Pro) deacylase) n=1 Tax=Streptosporangium becharense TaxID=1816182 RepID=A0A7W9IGP8_9ACTN|nr:YbaK/EbsC family protein [Streptosporangium becharense]MBB2912714.1 prolyl-tRNA editing enzyme YbaK/EbsC (Cys-tRNA(Pro) deacylase) [Streptosporangium becharense]MBB5820457.1 prolyl-tRNA editing enzyme YbaK/EbsC (Cys-tRNA(Pro) deacylase) [Streptosporangium becharense]